MDTSITFVVDYAHGPYIGRVLVDAHDEKEAVGKVLERMNTQCGWLPSCVQSGKAKPRDKG